MFVGFVTNIRYVHTEIEWFRPRWGYIQKKIDVKYFTLCKRERPLSLSACQYNMYVIKSRRPT